MWTLTDNHKADYELINKYYVFLLHVAKEVDTDGRNIIQGEPKKLST